MHPVMSMPASLVVHAIAMLAVAMHVAMIA